MTNRDADASPLLARLSMFRKVVPPATQLLPRALLRMLVAAFPVRTRVRELGRVVGTMYSRAGDIYADKKRAFAEGDAEVVRQVQRGKDTLSILSEWAFGLCWCHVLTRTLVRANAALDEKDRLTEEEVVAQMT